MGTVDYVRLLRARWPLVAGAVVLALVIGWFTTPGSESGRVASGSYTATHVQIVDPLISPNGSTVEPLNVERLSLFAVTGEVPKAVVRRLKLSTPPQQLVNEITVKADPDIGSLSITATSSDPRRATAVANAFGEELRLYVVALQRDQTNRQLVPTEQRVAEVRARIGQLQSALVNDPKDPVASTELDVQSARLGSLLASQNLLEDRQLVQPLRVLQPATAVPGESSFSAPSGRASRLLIALLLALILSLGLLVVLDRLDDRVRTSEAVEAITRLPVLAEVPRLDRQDRRRRSVVVAAQPAGAAAEAYRTLRASLLLMPSRTVPSPLTDADADPDNPAYGSLGEPQVILVTSPSPREGKTTSVANLAAAMSEAGRSVLILDCDFRQPAIHSYLDVPVGPGLSDLIDAKDPGRLQQVARPTLLPNVRLVTTGPLTAHPSSQTAQMGAIIAHARTLADVVIVDSAPLLTASDTSDLIPHVDTVLVVVRAGSTTTERAQRVSERLSRLGVATAGVVLVGTAPDGRDLYYQVAHPAPAPASSRRQLTDPPRGSRRRDRHRPELGSPPSEQAPAAPTDTPEESLPGGSGR